ncbi:uncharacterized protein CCR75_007813 [Bremia lactucae]|uniref:Haloacid dehalogenase-like hydrolase n=1 Tax=Bremia lactucae TaxID=4779 RepID=A0A976P014_BRELC|nr:hypothetical protein CCR75_007813 [Bremia lactucae]
MPVVLGVTFDLDDTLWCGKTVLQNASGAFHAYVAQELPELAEQFPPASFDALLVQFQRALPEHAHDYTFLRKHTLRHCVTTFGAQKLHLHDESKLTAFVDAAFRAFVVPRSQPELFDGVEHLFRELTTEITLLNRPKNATATILGIITNGNCDITSLPEFFQHYIHFIISAELVGCAKPSQAIFDAAVSKFSTSCRRHHFVHVGDHYTCDVEGAKRAGFRTIWVNSQWPRHDAFTRADLIDDDAAQYTAADAIVKDVKTVVFVVQHWNALALETEGPWCST